MNPDIVLAGPATRIMCKLFVEKTLKEQEEIVQAAVSTEPDKAQQGYQLNIQQGVWVRPVEESGIPAPVSSDIPNMEE